jgi:3-deoxy-D-manno-octulosonate 8-phosphate phosphatase (KDO 8-P phosphatase)
MTNQALWASAQLVILDFDGVLTDNAVYVAQDGHEMVRCCRSDGLGISRLQNAGISVHIVSTEKNPVVAARAKKLNLPFKQGVEDKAEAVLDICRAKNISPTHTVFVGNDINDIPAFKSVGIPVAVSDAYPEVHPYVIYRTERAGGFGAVREICDLIFKAKMDQAS